MSSRRGLYSALTLTFNFNHFRSSHIKLSSVHTYQRLSMFSGLTTISTTFVFPLRRLAVVSFLIDSATLLPIIGY